MAENRFKARQQKRAVEEESRLEQAKGGTTSVSAKNHGNQKIEGWHTIGNAESSETSV